MRLPFPSLYYPQAAEHSLDLLPRTIALISCFLPFVLAAPSLIREKEAHTLEILLAAPRIKPGVLFVGKCFFPIVVGLFEFLLMLVLAQPFYHVDVKSGLLQIALFLLPALLSSTLLGLAVSAVANSQPQSMMSSAIYFLALTLLTGFLYPLSQGSALIQGLSKLFPLTFVSPVLNAWMFGAHFSPFLLEAVMWLSFQCVFYGILALLAFLYALRHI
jgi:ABC-type multidrug transport system permease subunit